VCHIHVGLGDGPVNGIEECDLVRAISFEPAVHGEQPTVRRPDRVSGACGVAWRDRPKSGAVGVDDVDPRAFRRSIPDREGDLGAIWREQRLAKHDGLIGRGIDLAEVRAVRVRQIHVEGIVADAAGEHDLASVRRPERRPLGGYADVERPHRPSLQIHDDD
jgi:hypothetical protein